MQENELAYFNQVKEALLDYKDKLRGCDYHLSAIVMYKHMEGRCRSKVQELLYTLAQIFELLYIQEYKRNPKIILRLHNLTFKHAILCREIIGTPHNLTSQKFYGIYWHSTIVYAPITIRIISPRSYCCEEQERQFNTIKSITKKTSSFHHSHVIPNSILRAQAEEMLREKPKPVISQHSLISQYASTMPPPSNTTFDEGILKHSDYQAHLERIADFLAPGEGIWWHYDYENEVVVFHDGEEEPEKRPEGPDLHYFRSWSLQGEADYLKQKWRECLSSELIIPSPIIKLYDENGDYVSQKVYLHQFVPNALQNLPNSPDTHQEALHLDVNPPLISSINDPVEYDDEEINDEIPISLAVLEGDNDISQNTLIADDLIDLPETSFNQERASENYHNLTAAEELSHVDQNLEDTINKGGDRSKKSHQRILSSATNSTSPKKGRGLKTHVQTSQIYKHLLNSSE